MSDDKSTSVGTDRAGQTKAMSAARIVGMACVVALAMDNALHHGGLRTALLGLGLGIGGLSWLYGRAKTAPNGRARYVAGRFADSIIRACTACQFERTAAAIEGWTHKWRHPA